MAVFDPSDFNHNFGFLGPSGLVNDGSGDENAIDNYLSAPVEFYMQPPVDAVWTIRRVIISIVGDIGKDGYGHGDPLVNGITLQHTDSEGNLIVEFTSGVPVLVEDQWADYCFDVEPRGKLRKIARWTIGESGLPIVLEYQERLSVTLNDNFTHLSGHRFNTQGQIANYLYGVNKR